MVLALSDKPRICFSIINSRSSSTEHCWQPWTQQQQQQNKQKQQQQAIGGRFPDNSPGQRPSAATRPPLSLPTTPPLLRHAWAILLGTNYNPNGLQLAKALLFTCFSEAHSPCTTLPPLPPLYTHTLPRSLACTGACLLCVRGRIGPLTGRFVCSGEVIIFVPHCGQVIYTFGHWTSHRHSVHCILVHIICSPF